MTMKGKLFLTDITRYDDVETGRLVLTVGEKMKSWYVTWLTNLHIQWKCVNQLPAGCYQVVIRPNRLWRQCPRMKVTRLVGMWIEPFDAECWNDMGVNLYLLDKPEHFRPLGRSDYQQFVDALTKFDITELTVDSHVKTVHGNKFHQESDEEFWD